MMLILVRLAFLLLELEQLFRLALRSPASQQQLLEPEQVLLVQLAVELELAFLLLARLVGQPF